MTATRPYFPADPTRIRVELVVPDGLDDEALARVRTRMLGVGLASLGEEILLAAPLPGAAADAMRAASEDAVEQARRHRRKAGDKQEADPRRTPDPAEGVDTADKRAPDVEEGTDGPEPDDAILPPQPKPTEEEVAAREHGEPLTPLVDTAVEG